MPNYTGIDGMIAYINSQSIGQGALAGNFVGFAILIPMWFIIFFILARYRPIGAVAVASFVCSILTLVLMAADLITSAILPILAGITVVATIMAYYESKY